jgi:prepilin signal peptidase PulO-like enzyme (type II secretory pathway)
MLSKTCQDLTDEILGMGLSRPSLVALVDAFRIVLKSGSGYGDVTISFKAGQVSGCEFRGTIKPDSK